MNTSGYPHLERALALARSTGPGRTAGLDTQMLSARARCIENAEAAFTSTKPVDSDDTRRILHAYDDARELLLEIVRLNDLLEERDAEAVRAQREGWGGRDENIREFEPGTESQRDGVVEELEREGWTVQRDTQRPMKPYGFAEKTGAQPFESDVRERLEADSQWQDAVDERLHRIENAIMFVAMITTGGQVNRAIVQSLLDGRP